MNSFSQIGTVSRQDTTKIVLSTTVARKIALDLVTGDKAKEQVQVLQKLVDSQNSLILNKDSTIQVLEENIKQRISVSQMDSLFLEQKNADLKDLEKVLKKTKRTGNVYKFGAFGALAAALTILIFK